MSFKRQIFESPIGPLMLFEKDGKLEGVIYPVKWPKFRARFNDYEDIETPLLKETKKQLAEYFSGERKDFDLPLRLAGTIFQNKVWSILAHIPFGHTRTYKEQAIAAKSPKAVRAVGTCNGANPLSIVLPCHRVIGTGGALTGYGGGLKNKEFLLNLEAGSKLRPQPSAPKPSSSSNCRPLC